MADDVGTLGQDLPDEGGGLLGAEVHRVAGASLHLVKSRERQPDLGSKIVYSLNGGWPGNGNTGTPINTAPGTTGRPIMVGKEAWAIAIMSTGRTACAVSYEPSPVTPISAAGTPIKAGKHPFTIAITP